ncbi:MAG: Holliday junction branch migration protein RuvA [bacterium]
MISQLKGKITYAGDRFVIIDVGGVGYKVFTTSDILLNIDNDPAKTITLWTYLSVKEDALDLYGFQEKTELDFFEKIISVSGIGPKKALGILSIAPVETLRKAISSRDISYLTQVSGIGSKNAEKIVLELKDKMGPIEGEIDHGGMKEESDIIMAIKSLGYTANDARNVLKKIPKEITGVSDKIKWALKELGK